VRGDEVDWNLAPTRKHHAELEHGVGGDRTFAKSRRREFRHFKTRHDHSPLSARPSLSGVALPHRPVFRSDGEIIELKFESRFNCRDESGMNVSTAIFRRNRPLTTQTHAVA
jgi:hypothetical protein